jgi:A/G-specific adenine glycosylase
MPDQKVFSQQLITWWMSNRRKFPWRKQLPLSKALLVEVMLQRTKADQVRKPFIRFDSKYRTADELSSMSIQDAARIFKTLGLNWRVPLFHDLAHDVFRMSHNELASFLPTEYNHFKPKYLS